MLSSNAKACKAALLPCRLISEYSAEQVLSESYHVKNIDDFVAAQVAVHRSCQTVSAEEKALHGDEVGNITLSVVVYVALNRCRHFGSAARYLGVRKSALVNFQVVDLTLEAGVVTIVGFSDIAACARAHIGYLTVTVPDAYLGDIMSDLSKRRGSPIGMSVDKDGNQVVEAEVPMGEMTTYLIDLRSMTQGRGSYQFKFTRYEMAPEAVQNKIIEEAKANADE